MRTLILLQLLLILGWHAPVQAFFCFTFGGHARNAPRAWLPHPPPPRLYLPYAGTTSAPASPETALPPIREPEAGPELIQGYRFRPLTGAPPQAPGVPSGDWRN